MAQEPQRPQPLRLQADYKILRDRQRALEASVRAGDTNKANELQDATQAVIAFVRAYKGV